MTQKIAICAQICRAISSQLSHVPTIIKKVLNSNTSSTRPHNMANFSPLTAEICWRVQGTPANFNGFRVLTSLLQRRRSPAANQTLHDVWCLPGCYTIYTFSGALAPGRILPGAKFTLRPSLAFSYIGSVTARHFSSGRQPNCGVVQGITELSQRAPPIFGWAAITLGIGPHSSSHCSV